MKKKAQELLPGDIINLYGKLAEVTDVRKSGTEYSVAYKYDDVVGVIFFKPDQLVNAL